MNSEEKKLWLVALAGHARKSLDLLPSRDRERIRTALDEMELNPFQGDLRKLKGSHQGFRRRAGDWRIFFDLDFNNRRVLVTAIQRRTSTTY
ncbi:MAG: type II toxin-antitoxin system RelE family toxin [Terriglobia bacterium]